MKVRIEHGGGYQETAYEAETLPRVGETFRMGDWEGEVIKVTHIATRTASGSTVYRDDDDPVALLELKSSHRVKTG
jgi:hypothetical protein